MILLVSATIGAWHFTAGGLIPREAVSALTVVRDLGLVVVGLLAGVRRGQ